MKSKRRERPALRVELVPTAQLAQWQLRELARIFLKPLPERPPDAPDS